MSRASDRQVPFVPLADLRRPFAAPARRSAAGDQPFSVALVNMPWARNDAPSIQCGLLQAALESAGYQARSLYLNLELSCLLGPRFYDAITEAPSERIHLLGEWLFSPVAFDVPDDDEEAYLREFPEVAQACSDAGMSWPEVVELRRVRLPAWIDEIAARADWAQYQLVGFTSTFVQNVASLALAARLKQVHPALPNVFGGANFDDEMGVEYARAIPYLDYVVVGEGDVALLDLVSALARGQSPLGIPGICGRAADGAMSFSAPGPQVSPMDTVPMPVYDDYFATIDRLGRREAVGAKRIRLLVEFSRGCWWGEKHHCTFCGLNALGMKHRAKSPDQAYADLSELVRRHQILSVDAVDNIMDMSYLDGMCARLVQDRWDLDMFYEVKANLTRAQLELLAAAGIRRLQPGLESLSTHVLRLMRKGTTRLLNIRLLKWARYYGIDIAWNVLAGFPGECDEDYLDQARVMPLLTHLSPPGKIGRIWLERFSPHFSDDLVRFKEVEPRSAYRFAYPNTGLDYHKIAYFFDYHDKVGASDEAIAAVAAQIDAWHEAWAEPGTTLDYVRGPGWIDIRDTRPGRRAKGRLRGWQADAYEICGESPRSAEGLARKLREADSPVPVAQVDKFLDFAVRQQICIADEGMYFALALPQHGR